MRLENNADDNFYSETLYKGGGVQIYFWEYKIAISDFTKHWRLQLLHMKNKWIKSKLRNSNQIKIDLGRHLLSFSRQRRWSNWKERSAMYIHTYMPRLRMLFGNITYRIGNVILAHVHIQFVIFINVLKYYRRHVIKIYQAFIYQISYLYIRAWRMCDWYGVKTYFTDIFQRKFKFCTKKIK